MLIYQRVLYFWTSPHVISKESNLRRQIPCLVCQALYMFGWEGDPNCECGTSFCITGTNFRSPGAQQAWELISEAVDFNVAASTHTLLQERLVLVRIRRLDC